MADQAIGELIKAASIGATDLFVLEHSGTAKCLPGQVLLNWLTAAADGHGGISGINKVGTSGLVDTYRITLADTTTFDFVVNNGRGIAGISKTSTSGLVDTYTISYNNDTTSTFTVKNGAKGDKGNNSYVWIKYTSQKPTESSHSMGDIPDDWIGIYSGNASTAPTDWKQYKWFQIKGEKGDTGSPATLVSSEVAYQVSNSGTIIPSGNWSDSVPVVSQGKYLWTRTTSQFNTGDPIVAYSVARMGKDGAGSVSMVNNVSPDSSGNVKLTAADVGALPSSGGGMTGAINMNGQTLIGLNTPTASDEAATKGYVDRASKRSVSTSSAASMVVGATHKLKESIIAARPAFATLAYHAAIGRVSGGSGSREITFANIQNSGSGVYINLARFMVSDDGLTLTLSDTKRVSINDGGVTLESGLPLYFGEVYLIS